MEIPLFKSWLSYYNSFIEICKREVCPMRKAKRWVKVLVGILLAVVLLVGAYVAYVFLDYHRIGDQELEAQGEGGATALDTAASYSILSYNIGFGAYEDDYGFFMDGGTESWAWSEERLTENLNHIADFLKGQADFCLVQEVDIDSTRSYHVDEREPLCDAREGDSYVFAQNYDSPFLMYPLTQPHGASRSGLLTFSPVTITSANRVELPVETGVMKLLDLDRCYSVSRIPTNGSKELILYNLHLSAYTSDGTIATQQLKLLLADMQAEYEAGNWCVAGGDFNKDLLGDSAYYFGEADQAYSWAQPIPEGTFDNYDISLVAPLDESASVPSCRNADSAYHEGQYVLTVDGFLVSKNVTVENAAVVDTGFQWSDHNPVIMTFTLR
jgi:endonuclease/exonuclease/phosphatase family metal-dependent hydrolase